MTSILGGATVFAKDVERVSRFYEAACSLVVSVREPGFHVLENGPLQLVVVSIPEHIAREIQVSLPPQRREDTALKLMFVVASIASAREAALERGGIIDPPEREWQFQAMRVCDGHDPEGNVIQVRENAL